MSEPEGFREWADACEKALTEMAAQSPDDLAMHLTGVGATEKQIADVLEILRRGEFRITLREKRTEPPDEYGESPAMKALPWVRLSEHFRKKT